MATKNANTAAATRAAAADRFTRSAASVTETHNAGLARRMDGALRTLEGVDGKADLASDALSVWLPVCKLVANDRAAREAVLSAMAESIGADIYWIASLFAGVVETGTGVHVDAYRVRFTAKNEPKLSPLMGRRTVPAAQLSRAAYLEGIAKLSRQATEASMLACFQNVVGALVREGKLKV